MSHLSFPKGNNPTSKPEIPEFKFKENFDKFDILKHGINLKKYLIEDISKCEFVGYI